ncbi:MAG: aminomethyl-transferring glycine dehydrogenase [Myxococcota bacterium]
MPTLPPVEAFASRHIGPRASDIDAMLKVLGLESLEALTQKAVPNAIRMDGELDLPAALTEQQAMARLRSYADQNEVWRSYLGYGYHNTHTPPVILRNILENPGWYTAYTPYQAEISQGRLEALLVFQTMVQELTGMDLCGASLLDEATAAAEALTMCHRLKKSKIDAFFVDERTHPHTLAVVQTRAEPMGIEIVVADARTFDFSATTLCGALLGYPNTDGTVEDLRDVFARVKDSGALVVVASDLLALTVLESPGSLGADLVIGNSQRFGVPLGYGGPHAAFLACRTAYKRTMPGRIIGVSRDADGNPALRMALQTREQHIRRDKATSNICTAQVLLAVCAGMFAVWHGPDGLRQLAMRTHRLATRLAAGLRAAGHTTSDSFFDTVRVSTGDREAVLQKAADLRINLRTYGDSSLIIALDETTTEADLADVLSCFGATDPGDADDALPASLARTTTFCTDPVFSLHRSETEMMRYLHRLEAKDLALNTAMIPLGSCTMKLNAASEMIPITWSGFGGIHPFVPKEQAQGYRKLFDDLELWLAEITGFDAVSLQPNAGSQGEYTGLLTIRAYHHHRSESQRNICLIPTSAHGTNPASAVMAGMKVVTVKTDDAGNIDVEDLEAKAALHADHLAALMVTYPSTHGVFETAIRHICEVVHGHGGLVYMDGANMNAMVGLARPGDIGADVCHLNLHKTFCIPHGGGGPGMGPIGVVSRLAPFLPSHPVIAVDGAADTALGPVSAAPWGSPSILPISWAYIAMMGPDGLTAASQVAILAANYIAKRLEGTVDVLFANEQGFVAHECILDTRPFKASAEVSVDDFAKRLMDYGFHAPTMSWPVIGTLMVEPTESESLFELDRFIDAMVSLRAEIAEIESGSVSHEASVLAHAPFTATSVVAAEWDHPFSREKAAFPTDHQRVHKYWPGVRRIDNVYGDKNLICSCDAWPSN